MLSVFTFNNPELKLILIQVKKNTLKLETNQTLQPMEHSVSNIMKQCGKLRVLLHTYILLINFIHMVFIMHSI